LGVLGLFEHLQGAAWFRRTPAYHHWTGMLGEPLGRPVLNGLLGFLVAVGLFVAATPLLFPSTALRRIAAQDVTGPAPLVDDAFQEDLEPRYKVEAAILDLRSEDDFRNNAAVGYLESVERSASPDQVAAVRRELVRLAQGPRNGGFVRHRALDALRSWGTSADIPALQGLAGDDDREVVRRSREAINDIRRSGR
jgi:hypothetical protein